MKYRWVHVKTKDRLSTDELEVPCGNQICGLQMRGNRPSSIELTFEELKYLLETPKYAQVVLFSLWRNIK